MLHEAKQAKKPKSAVKKTQEALAKSDVKAAQKFLKKSIKAIDLSLLVREVL